MLLELVVSQVKERAELRGRFDELGMVEIDIRRIVETILQNQPICGPAY